MQWMTDLVAHWQVPVILKIVAANVIAQPLIKKLTNGEGSQTRKFTLQFLVCFLIAAVIVAISGGCDFGREAGIIFAIGIANAVAAFYYWKSIGYSLSKNALFTVWDDIIAMTLAFVVLHETKFLNWWVGAGITMSFIALVLFFLNSWKKHKKTLREDGKEIETTPPRFYGYVAVYSLIWGVAQFAIRYYVVNGVSAPTFLMSWYGGAAVGATTIFLLGIELNPKRTGPLTSTGVKLAFLCGAAVVASLIMQRASYHAPQMVVQPIFMVGEMVIPALIGLRFFDEKKQFAKKEWWYLAISIVGAVLLFANDWLQQIAEQLF